MCGSSINLAGSVSACMRLFERVHGCVFACYRAPVCECKCVCVCKCVYVPAESLLLMAISRRALLI